MRSCVLSLALLTTGVIAVSTSASTTAFSEQQLTESAPQKAPDVQDPMTYQRGLTRFQDDITPDQDPDKVKLTQAQTHQATVWQLTTNEEQRYVLLMHNRSGLYWQHTRLSPVEVLGINARTTAERDKYARLYARQLQARLAKELAWQSAADQAKRELNEGRPLVRPFNVKPFSPYSYTPVSLHTGDRLVLFTQIALPVERVMTVLLQAMQTHPDVPLDIFFADHPKDTAVQQWAATQNIPRAWVVNHRITLNTRAGPLAQMGTHPALPLLIQERSGAAYRVDLSRF